jgi:hypothetical protein
VWKLKFFRLASRNIGTELACQQAGKDINDNNQRLAKIIFPNQYAGEESKLTLANVSWGHEPG